MTIKDFKDISVVLKKKLYFDKKNKNCLPPLIKIPRL